MPSVIHFNVLVVFVFVCYCKQRLREREDDVTPCHNAAVNEEEECWEVNASVVRRLVFRPETEEAAMASVQSAFTETTASPHIFLVGSASRDKARRDVTFTFPVMLLLTPETDSQGRSRLKVPPHATGCERDWPLQAVLEICPLMTSQVGVSTWTLCWDGSACQPPPGGTVADVAHLSVTHIGGHAHLCCQKRQIFKIG